MAFVFVSLGFLLLSTSSHFQTAGLISAWWIPISYLFITLGEMFLSPIGLSAVTVLAPKQWVGMMMGIWLIAIGYGGKIAGVLAKLSSIPEGVTDPVIESHYYGRAFFIYAMLSLALALITLCLVPWLKRLSSHE